MKRIFNYLEFIKESTGYTPETKISHILTKIKNKIESLFESGNEPEHIHSVDTLAQKNKKDKGNMSFSDLGLQLESSEISKYSKIQDSYKVKFSDNDYLYDITFIIDLSEAVPEPKQANTEMGEDGEMAPEPQDTEQEEVEEKDIKNCIVKFKKYSAEDLELLSEMSKTVEVETIDEDLLISLKIELDEQSGTTDDNDKLEIETN